jgi:hypothetical protein
MQPLVSVSLADTPSNRRVDTLRNITINISDTAELVERVKCKLLANCGFAIAKQNLQQLPSIVRCSIGVRLLSPKCLANAADSVVTNRAGGEKL